MNKELNEKIRKDIELLREIKTSKESDIIFGYLFALMSTEVITNEQFKELRLEYLKY